MITLVEVTTHDVKLLHSIVLITVKRCIDKKAFDNGSLHHYVITNSLNTV
jgi:hypothetical protein